MVFVTDMEHTLAKLEIFDKKLIAMYVVEEFTVPEMARRLVCSKRTVERYIGDALDKLSALLIDRRLLDRIPGGKTCQGGKEVRKAISYS